MAENNEVQRNSGLSVAESWSKLPPLLKVWIPVSCFLNLFPLFSISANIVELHGFIAQAVVFYREFTYIILYGIYSISGFSVPQIGADGVILYTIIAGTFIRTIGLKSFPDIVLHVNWNEVGKRGAMARITAVAIKLNSLFFPITFPIASVLILRGLEKIDLVKPEGYSLDNIIMSIGGLGFCFGILALILPLQQTVFRKYKGANSGNEPSRGMVALFYSALAATVLLFAFAAGVSEGLDQISE